MKRKSLQELAVGDLVEQFAEIGVSQDRALTYSKIAMFKKLYGQMTAVDKELRRRGRDARLALCKLYAHPNYQVRLQAARLTLGVAPTEARQTIEAIARSGRMPQAGDARGTLRNLDTGFYKPD